MLPNLRGVIATRDGGEVIFELTGRTVWVDRDGQRVGRQLLMMLLESADDRYAWLNNTVCICEGAFDPAVGSAHINVFTCTSEL
jgi:hypothetical protein